MKIIALLTGRGNNTLKDKNISLVLEPNYFLCHNFWVLNVSKSIYTQDGEAPWSFMGKKVLPYEVEDSFDIHAEKDLIKTSKWLIKNGITI